MAPTLSFVLPAFNEEANIAESVRRCASVLSRLEEQGAIVESEIVVVDDGSRDGTVERARSVGEARLRIVMHAENRGYGAALRSGFRSSRGELVFFTDSDLQFDVEELERLLPYAEQYDIVAGFRMPRQDPWVRRANAAAWAMALYGAFGLEVQDVNCAFKLFRSEVLQGLEISSDGAFVNAEILLKAAQRGWSIKQVPVSHFPRAAGEQTGADPKVVFRALRELARFYRQRHTGVA